MDKLNISAAFTHYNRPELLKQAFPDLVGYLSEIVIVDDFSRTMDYEEVRRNHGKQDGVRIYRNDRNMGMSLNKERAVMMCDNEWVALLDSDNIFKRNYFEALPKELESDVIYCPDFAAPNFNYTKFHGIINRENVKQFLKFPLFDALSNTCNYVVHRETYLSVYRHNPNMKATDSAWFFYLWLAAGNSFFVVPNMRYFHRVHPESGFLKDAEYNMQKSKEIRKLIEQLW